MLFEVGLELVDIFRQLLRIIYTSIRATIFRNRRLRVERGGNTKAHRESDLSAIRCTRLFDASPSLSSIRSIVLPKPSTRFFLRVSSITCLASSSRPRWQRKDGKRERLTHEHVREMFVGTQLLAEKLEIGCFFQIR